MKFQLDKEINTEKTLSFRKSGEWVYVFKLPVAVDKDQVRKVFYKTFNQQPIDIRSMVVLKKRKNKNIFFKKFIIKTKSEAVKTLT